MPPAAQARRPVGGRYRAKAFTPIPRPAPRSDPSKCCDSPQHETIDGAKICANCGTQLSDQNIVAEVTFGETSAGAATVQGGFVGETARHARTLGAAAHRRIGGGAYQSREETEQNGKRALNEIVAYVHVGDNLKDAAFNLWKLAANVNFIQGRRTKEVAGCCLYAVCRRDKENAVLLMDISEAVKSNVFTLGDTYKELSKALYLEVKNFARPIVEVEPLIIKYANRLDFGDQTRQVAEDACRIIKRMKRDWLVTGRNPAGLCGACIILAARMNNFRRTVREVVYIVKVADMTIATRLKEFKQTRSSAMTVGQFRNKANQLKYQHDPPSLHIAEERHKQLLDRKRKRDQREEARRTIDIPDDESELSSAQSSVAPSPTPEPRTSQESSQTSAAARRRSKHNAQDQSQQQPMRRDKDGFAIPHLPIDPALTGRASNDSSTQQSSDGSGSPIPSVTPDSETSTKKEKTKTKKVKPTIQFTDADFAEEIQLEDEIENILQDKECISSRNDIERQKLEDRAKQVAEQERAVSAAKEAERLRTIGRAPQTIPDSEIIGEDEFDDDPEVRNALLSEEQVRVKEKIWVAHNEDWLRAQQTKHLKRALDEAEGKGPDQRPIKRRKRSRMGDGTVLTEGGTPVESPADAATRMLDKRAPKWSQAIDYDALKRALGGGKRSETGSEGSETAASSPPDGMSVAADEDDDADESVYDGRGAALPTPPVTQSQPTSTTKDRDDGTDGTPAVRDEIEVEGMEDVGDDDEDEDPVDPFAQDADEDEDEDIDEEQEYSDYDRDEDGDYEAAINNPTGGFGFGGASEE